MSDLVLWVSDSLHDILGLSDRHTSEFLISLAKNSSSEDAFVRKLRDTGAITVSEKIASFAAELWRKVPHKTANRYQAQRDKEKAAVAQVIKSKSYLLLSDDEEDTSKVARRKSKEKERETEKERRSRKRKNIRKGKAAAESSESEEEKKAVKRPKDDSDSDEWEK